MLTENERADLAALERIENGERPGAEYASVIDPVTGKLNDEGIAWLRRLREKQRQQPAQVLEEDERQTAKRRKRARQRNKGMSL